MSEAEVSGAGSVADPRSREEVPEVPCEAVRGSPDSGVASGSPQAIAEEGAPVLAESQAGDGVLARETMESASALSNAEVSGVEADAAAVRRYIGNPGGKKRRGQPLSKPEEQEPAVAVTPEQRLLLLDTWNRSGLPAGDFASLVGLSKHTLYGWKKKFEELGPAGLVDHERGAPRGSRLPEITKRAILMMKQANPEWGCQRISDMLARGPGYPACATAVGKVLHDAGYELQEEPTRTHEAPERRFERAKPNELWQTDLFTFMLKRQNRRVFLIAFMDDHSRFLTGYGVHASCSTAMVLEVFLRAIGSFQSPVEVLTDNGPQFVTWRGKSQFSRECEKRGIRQIVARPRRPQTLGKVERFWGTLWREFLETAVFLDMEDARRRIGLFVDYYNFQRPHQGLEGKVTPAERYFGVSSTVLGAMKRRLQENALELARQGVPKQRFFLAGQIAGKPFSLHAEDERLYLIQEGGERKEVELVTPHGTLPMDAAVDEVPAPGESALDAGMATLAQSLKGGPVVAATEQGLVAGGPVHD